MLTQGTGLLLQDSCDDAITWLRKGLNALRQTGAGIVVPHFTLWLAEAYGKARRLDEAFPTLEEASSLVDSGKELFNEPELHRIRGELLLARSASTDPDVATNALACFGRAREAACRQRSRSLELRAAVCLARLLHREGRLQEAQGILMHAHYLPRWMRMTNRLCRVFSKCFKAALARVRAITHETLVGFGLKYGRYPPSKVASDSVVGV